MEVLMLTSRQRLVGVLALTTVIGCTPPDLGPPPLFNAIDPSVTCPAGKVGWDFSTGGNDSDVVPVPVGNEIKIQEVKYGCSGQTLNIDLTASFRADCDNAVRCEREILKPSDTANLSCSVRQLSAKYKCGNEPTLYDISRLKRGNASLDVRMIDQLPRNGPSDKVLFVCGDTINVKGFLPSEGSSMMSKLTSCNGRRRCYSNNIDDIKDATGIGTNPRYFYTCGRSTAVREAVAEYRAGANGKPIDFSCADEALQTGFEPNAAIYFKELTFSRPGAESMVTALSERVKSACEGRRACEVSVSEAVESLDGFFKVEYWCGASRAVSEKKYYYSRDLGYTGFKKLSLGCGGRLKIVSSNQPWVAKECVEGNRVCSVPPGESGAQINFFCEGLSGASEKTIGLYDTENQTAPAQRTLECPLETKGEGIELINLRQDDGRDYSPLIQDVAVCNGKTSCLVRPSLPTTSVTNPDRALYEYQCSGTNERKTATSFVSNGQKMNYLDCKPLPRVTEVSGCYTAPSSALACLSRPSAGCTLDLSAGATPATIRACTRDIIIKYTCGSERSGDGGVPVYSRSVSAGSFPPSSSPDGGTYGADGGSLFEYTVDCPYDPTPRANPSSKACIPKTCAAGTKRNAQMECEVDGTIALFPSFSISPAFWDPAKRPIAATSELKEGFPYRRTLLVSYNGNPQITTAHAGTIWAYDVFQKNDGTGAEVKGFRCILSTPTLRYNLENTFAPEVPYVAVLGDSIQSATIPGTCFNAPFGDVNSSWYHGSRKAGLNEQSFRNTYRLVRTEVVGSFETKGRAGVLGKDAPNPIGFFYTPATGYIDQFDYFAQTTDFSGKKVIRFVPSTQIELSATSGRLDQSEIEVGPNSFSQPPTLSMNFGWLMLGDSQFHPHSPRTRVAGAERTSLRNLNLKAVLEIAKDDAALSNKWVPANSALIASVPLTDGNAHEKIDRLTVQLPVDVVKRMMSVRGSSAQQRLDGWMSNRIEVNAVFKARVCLDFNGIARAPVAVDNNRFVSATVGGVVYRLGVTQRCTPEVPFTVTRDLFPTPVLPVNGTERGVDKGKTTGQGGSLVSSGADQATQQSCRKQCSVDADCGLGGRCEKPTSALGVCARTSERVDCSSEFRAGSTVGGSLGFGYTLFSAQSRGATNSMTRTATATNTTTAEVLGFNLLSSTETLSGQTTQGTKKEIKLSLSRLWATGGAIADVISKFTRTANPKPVKPWWKPGVSKPFGGKDPQPGIAFGIARDGPVWAGIVFLHGEFSLGVGLGFDLTLSFIEDAQNVTNMSNPAYPCLGSTRCLRLSSAAAKFVDANEDCQLQGGRLAEPRTAADLAAIRAAAGSNDIWIGAQGSHIFEDATCAALSGSGPVPGLTQAEAQARLDQCKSGSLTRYRWISDGADGGMIADSEPNGRLFNVRDGGHGFGSLSTISNALASPLRSGLMLKTDGAVEAHRTTNQVGTLSVGAAPREAKYVCQFDPAARFASRETLLTPSLEFSAGAGAALCFPTTVIGACLAAELKFFTASLLLDVGSRTIEIFPTLTAVEPSATLGSSGTTLKWEVAFLTGGVGVELRFLIGSKNYELVRYSGVARWEGVIWEDVDRFRR